MNGQVRAAACGWVLVVGCATSSGSSQGQAAARPAAQLPPATSATAWLSWDARGAYGPYLVSHLDVEADGKVSCLRLPVTGEARHGSLALTEAERSALEATAKAVNWQSVKQVPRPAPVQDVGVVTLAGTAPGLGHPLVMDPQQTLEPVPADLLAGLQELNRRCLEAAGP